MSHLGVIRRHSSYKQFTQDSADDEIHTLIVLVLFEAPLQVASECLCQSSSFLKDTSQIGLGPSLALNGTFWNARVRMPVYKAGAQLNTAADASTRWPLRDSGLPGMTGLVALIALLCLLGRSLM